MLQQQALFVLPRRTVLTTLLFATSNRLSTGVLFFLGCFLRHHFEHLFLKLQVPWRTVLGLVLGLFVKRLACGGRRHRRQWWWHRCLTDLAQQRVFFHLDVPWQVVDRLARLSLLELELTCPQVGPKRTPGARTAGQVRHLDVLLAVGVKARLVHLSLLLNRQSISKGRIKR